MPCQVCVGDELGVSDDYFKYRGTVVGIDGCVYRIPLEAEHIPKYDPINDVTSFVGGDYGEKYGEYLYCTGGALGRDGCIYAVTIYGKVLKIDTVNNSYDFVGNSIQFEQHSSYESWGDAVLGIDGCIYWPPHKTEHTVKYDPPTDQITLQLVGGDFGEMGYAWYDSGALATDGVIYCFPSDANRVLAIEPIREDDKYDADADAAVVAEAKDSSDSASPTEDVETKDATQASEEKPAVAEEATAATTSANIPASTVTTERIIPADEQQVVVVIKSEPPNSISSSSSQTTTDEAFDQRDYDMLRIHYLQPKVEKNEEIPSGMRLRKRKAPAAIDGKTEGYKQLKRQIEKLEKGNDDKGI